jgi:hypothetical protein
MWSTTWTRLPTTVLLSVCAAGSMLGCDRDSTARGPSAGTPRVVDHPLLDLGRNGHLAGPPVAVAGVRCFRQVPRSGPEGDAWFYCVADTNMNIDAPRALPPERTDVRIASACTRSRRSATGPTRMNRSGPSVASTEFLGRFLGPPGHRIGYVMSDDGQGGMYGRTVFELRDPTTKEYIGALCVIVTRFP